uniref:Reverse transcriptase domain-containing protein n=1 Tax=Sus scrofa TaxID=9823 RepID=A0A8D1SWA6_PIG
MVQHMQINKCDTPHQQKNKNQRIILIDVERTCDNIQHLFMIKTLIKVGIKGIYLNMVNIIYDRLTSNIILNSEKLKAFPLKSGIRQGCPHLPCLLSYSSWINK